MGIPIVYADIIAEQAVKIIKQARAIHDFNERLSRIRLHLICVGGPLNDNKSKYSSTQLELFQKILNIVE